MPKPTGYLPLRGDDDDDRESITPTSAAPEERQFVEQDGEDGQSDGASSNSNSSHRTGHGHSGDRRHTPVTTDAASAMVTSVEGHKAAAATTTTTTTQTGRGATPSSALSQGLNASQLSAKSSPAELQQSSPLRRSGSSSSLSNSSSPFRFPRLGQISKHTSRPSFLTGASNVYGSSPKKKSFLGRIERGNGNTSRSRISGEESLRSLLGSPSSTSSSPGAMGRRGLSLFSSKKDGSTSTHHGVSNISSSGWSDLSNIRPKRHPYTTSSGPRGIHKAQKRQILREIRPDLRHLPEALLREQAKAGAIVEAQLRQGSSLASESEWDDHMSSAETIDERQDFASTDSQHAKKHERDHAPLVMPLPPASPVAAAATGSNQLEQQIEVGKYPTGTDAGDVREEATRPHDNNSRENLLPSLSTESSRYSTEGGVFTGTGLNAAGPHRSKVHAESSSSGPSAPRPTASTIQTNERTDFLTPGGDGLGLAHAKVSKSAPDVLPHNAQSNDFMSIGADGQSGNVKTRIRRQRRGGAEKGDDRVLQTSVFTPIETPRDEHGQTPPPPPPLTPDHAEPMTSNRFVAIVESVKEAIRSGIQPLRIAQGSSGSYFCRNADGKIVGVFKPKNEEPYGQLNPKWTKWVHRNFLIPNLGYISESAASLMDRRLKLNIVPPTEVVWLSSPAFHYDYLDRRAAQNSKGHKPLPEKVGSFQLFLNGFKDANLFMRDHPWPAEIPSSYSEGSALMSGGKTKSYGTWGRRRRPSPESARSQENNSSSSGSRDPERASLAGSTTGTLAGWPAAPPNGDGFQWTPQLQQQFREQFEKMILLDYLIRNTDRGLDNWMIRYCEKEGISIVAGTGATGPSAQKINTRRGSRVGEILSSSFRSSTSSLRELVVRNNSVLATPPGTPPRSTYSSTAPAGMNGPSVSGVEMLHDEPETAASSTSASATATTSLPNPPKTPLEHIENYYGANHVHIAAIDNGLAFPFKHPDSWRSYPYGWLFLPRSLIKQPFTQATRDHFLPLLSNPQWWRETIADLQRLFRIDSDFDQRMFDKQMAVMKGQGWNIVETLKNPESGPLDLCRRVAVVVWDEEVTIERRRVVIRDANGAIRRPSGDKHPSPKVTTKLISPGSQVNQTDNPGRTQEGYISITVDPPATEEYSEHRPIENVSALHGAKSADNVGPTAFHEAVSDDDGRSETDGLSFDLEDSEEYEEGDESEDDDEETNIEQGVMSHTPRRRRAFSQDGLMPVSPNERGELMGSSSQARKPRERGRQYRRALRKSSTSVDSGLALGGGLGGARRPQGQSLAGAAQTLALPSVSSTTQGDTNQQDRGAGPSSLHVRRRTEQDDQMGSVGRGGGLRESTLMYYSEGGPQPGSQHELQEPEYQQQQRSREIGFGSTSTETSPSVESGKKVNEESLSVRRRWADRLRRGLSFDGQLLRGGLAGLDSKKNSKKGRREVIKERRVIRVERIEAVTTNKPYFTWW
ncbi:phosphatidyl inositol kinase [Actinomortierella wolfii]|nr:phosphatidyl inositol kinase [Actinomortierella wolfii]